MAGYRKVPDFVRDLIARCDTDTFYIGRTRSYSLQELAQGKLAHLGITVEGGTVNFEPAVLPPAGSGRWSRYNIDGYQKVRRDLPKISKTIGGWQSPNFGDWSKGSHTHYRTQEVFQRETWYGQRLPILIDVQASEGDKFIIGFRVGRVFDRSALDAVAERDLRLACSLLRENIESHASIVSTALSVAQWLANQRVDWEILPVGKEGARTFDEVVKRLKADPTDPRVTRMRERYDVVAGMRPAAVIVGQGEFSRYFGFQFRSDLVALESLEYGNALYLMYEDWKVLSKRTRIELLADTSANYDRVVHVAGWAGRLATLLHAKGHNTAD